MTYADEEVIAPGDSDAVIVEKAAHLLPRPNQIAWSRMERTFFIHFGVNTFTHRQWGTGQEDPAIFNPTALDAEQWVRAIRDAGGKMVILVCKHHDGFAMWPSLYTSHSVAASPWLGGRGDEVRMVADAARKYGVKFGIYLSPADLYQLTTNPKNPGGYYGNGSAALPSLIPTDPAHFKTNPARGRTPVSGFGSYQYQVDDYNRYFLNQLYELLTEYGPIGEVWFDGANPNQTVHETYDHAAWYDLIRHLQPQAVIFGKGPDARWVGNESGIARTAEWSVIPLPDSPKDFNWSDMTGSDLGSRAMLKPGSHLWWYPAEADTPLLLGWFWAPGEPTHTTQELVDTYYTSVGRNCNWLLNLSPDSRGLVPDDQLAVLGQSSQIIRETFAKNLATRATASADSSTSGHPAAQALDENLDTWWEPAAGQTTGTFTLTFSVPVTFDVVSLQEAIAQRGQRIESFEIETWDGSRWSLASTTEEQATVGYKRLMRLKSPATTDRVRIRITASRQEPTLAEVGLFNSRRAAAW